MKMMRPLGKDIVGDTVKIRIIAEKKCLKKISLPNLFRSRR
jgi:hypothetical protein